MRQLLNSAHSHVKCNGVVKEKSDALTQSAMKLDEALYKAQQEAEGAAGGDGEAPAPESAKDADVVDAEFEEVDESSEDSGADKKDDDKKEDDK